MRSLTPLISPEALQIALADKNSPLSVIDASWHLPNSDRDSRKEFEQTHIPRAVFFDIDTVSDQSSSLPHMLPSARSFAESMRQLGVGPSHRVVVYDTHGLFSAARVWWI